MNKAKLVVTVVLTALYTASTCFAFLLERGNILQGIGCTGFATGGCIIFIFSIRWIVVNWEKP